MTHSPYSIAISLALCLAACGGDGVAPSGSADAGALVPSDGANGPAPDPNTPRPPVDAPPVDASIGPADGRASDDAGSVDADAPEQPPEGVPIFVAQGDVGRTMISCDDGHTWTADRSTDPSIRCFDRSRGNFDCNHHAGAARGISFGEGAFYATFGWGTPGRVLRSVDGARWEELVVGRAFSGVSRGRGIILAGARFARYSTDDGRSFAETGPTIVGYNVRRSAFAPHGDGVFVLVGEAGDIAVSRDGGRSFERPPVPNDCGGNIQWSGGIAYGNGILLVLSGNGVACRSTDGGSSWSRATVGGSITSDLVFDGTAFLAFGGGRAHRSLDGLRWSSSAITPPIDLGAIARSEEGTFVAVRAGRRDYETQELYRSEDGRTWTPLPRGAFRGGHPIRFMAFGRAPEGTVCR